MSNFAYSFKHRAVSVLPEQDVSDFISLMGATYTTLELTPRKRKLYFFANSVVQAQGGESNSIMAGYYEKNNQFYDLSTLSVPPPEGCEYIEFMVGRKRINAIMFTPVVYVATVYMNGLGSLGYVASEFEDAFGVPSGSIKAYSDAGSMLQFYLSVPYAIPADLFQNDVNIQTYVETTLSCTGVGDRAFLSCAALSAIALNGATTIGISAFEDCTMLNDCSINQAVTIGASAFKNTALNQLTLPQGTELGNEAFMDCNSLFNFVADSVTTLGANVFSGCGDLSTISLPALTTADKEAFGGWANATVTLNVPLAMATTDAVQNAISAGATVNYL